MTLWAGAEPFVHRLGWALIQFLWQGTVVAVLFATTHVLIGRWLSSRSRYAMACGALVLMAAAPFLTYVFSGRSSVRPVAWLVPVDSGWTQAVPWVVALWLAGVCVCSVRLAGGWVVTRRLRHVGTRPASAEWQQVFEDLARRLRLSRPVAFVVSTLVDVPTVVGWLEPVVLMPVEAMTSLPPQYIRTLLAHELAHVRRHDYIINVLQRVVETVLFYHPAVWWVSEQIRVEREMCCDDIVVAVEGDPLIYARALTELESVRRPHVAVLAANGSSLLHRIRRLLGHTLSAWQLLPGPAAIVAIAVVCGVGVAALRARNGDDALPVRSQTVPPPVPAPAQSLLAAALLGPVGPAAPQRAPSASTQSARPGMPASPMAVADSSAPGMIRGRIIRADTGLPLANAWLELYPEKPRENDPPWGMQVTTDNSGRYELRDLPPRRYWLRAGRRGFAPETYGSKGVEGGRRMIDVAAGKGIDLADLALSNGGVISGSVVDQAGDPLSGIVVQALRPAEWDNSRPGSEASADVTDDLGTFRMYGLAPGTYYLRALRPGTPVVMFERGIGPLALVYYPGTFQPNQAQGVSVQNGTEAAVTFTFAPGSRVAVSGTVSGADGTPVIAGTVSFRPHYLDNTQRIVERPITAGAFNVDGLPAAEYIVAARNKAGDEMLTKRVVIQGAPEHMALVLQRAATMRGRIVFETTQARSSVRPSDIQMAWFPQGFAPRSSGVSVRPDWTFEVTGLVGPQGFGHSPPEGWALKEVRYGTRPPAKETAVDLHGEDLDDVQVIFTDRITRISGRVTDGMNRVVAGVVVVFAENREQWRPGVRHAGTADVDADGGYTIASLPAGRYLAIAVDNAEELTASVLERLRRRATAVTLRDGERTTLNLTRTTP